jgi:hypothetical protein
MPLSLTDHQLKSSWRPQARLYGAALTEAGAIALRRVMCERKGCRPVRHSRLYSGSFRQPPARSSPGPFDTGNLLIGNLHGLSAIAICSIDLVWLPSLPMRPYPNKRVSERSVNIF